MKRRDESLTKQGVRNLDGKQENRRTRNAQETCFHEWEHADSCPCWLYDVTVCRESCRRCGKLR